MIKVGKCLQLKLIDSFYKCKNLYELYKKTSIPMYKLGHWYFFNIYLLKVLTSKETLKHVKKENFGNVSDKIVSKPC